MTVRIINADVITGLRSLPDNSVHMVMTSPPYWGLRDYGEEGQLGLEATLGEHIEKMVAVFREVRRVLRPDASVWLNYGDCYATTPNGRSAAATKAAGKDDRTFRDKPFSTVGGVLKPKDLCLAPYRLAIALQEDGWWVRSKVTWGKPSAMPDSSGKHRPSVAFEEVFLLTKTAKAYYDHEAVAQPVSGNTNSRVNRNWKAPDNWNTEPGAHGDFHPRGREKGRRPGVTPKSAPENSGIRANKSFHASTTAPVDSRYLRNYEPAPVAVWEVASKPFPGAHFATFPPELVSLCIAAGTSGGGVCSCCGAPLARVSAARHPDGRFTGKAADAVEWKPDCACGPFTPFPATVLDPFGGAGTVGMVAERMGRDSILIDISSDYCEMAEDRIVRDGGLLNPSVEIDRRVSS